MEIVNKALRKSSFVSLEMVLIKECASRHNHSVQQKTLANNVFCSPNQLASSVIMLVWGAAVIG